MEVAPKMLKNQINSKSVVMTKTAYNLRKKYSVYIELTKIHIQMIDVIQKYLTTETLIRFFSPMCSDR